MKKFAVILLTLVLCSISYGQSKYFSFKTVAYKEDTKEFSFPIFSAGANGYVRTKINQTLQIAELETLKGFETKSIFEEVIIDDGRIYGGKVDIAFKVYDNNSKVLSVKFDQSSCGATCTYWVKYYNFNSGNGDLIQLQDLFTESGFKKFFAFATRKRISQLKSEIRKLPVPERSGYEGISGTYEADDLTDFYIKKNILYIDGENSFSKGQKYSSIEINKISRFRLSEFKAYLNNYGKSLFELNNDAIKKHRSNVLPQLFQGEIADKAVLLMLNKGYEKEALAEYVYSKYGKGIFLEGTLNKDELTLTEKISKPRESGFIDYVDNGFIKAKFDGENIFGTWTNKDRTETYDLQLKRK